MEGHAAQVGEDFKGTKELNSAHTLLVGHRAPWPLPLQITWRAE